VQQLKQYLNSLYPISPISEELWPKIAALFKKETYNKGNEFVQEGMVCKKVAFVEQGLFRLFYRVKGEERIMLFFAENQFVTDYYSFLTQTESIRPIEALEDSIVYSIHHQQLQQLYTLPGWHQIGRLLAESAYIYSVQRANRIIHDDPDTRYLTLLKETPSLIQRVPQYMIASYLNMTPETLSRIKSRVHKKEDQTPPSIHDRLNN